MNQSSEHGYTLILEKDGAYLECSRCVGRAAPRLRHLSIIFRDSDEHAGTVSEFLH